MTADPCPCSVQAVRHGRPGGLRLAAAHLLQQRQRRLHSLLGRLQGQLQQRREKVVQGASEVYEEEQGRYSIAIHI